MIPKILKTLSPFCRDQIRRNIESEWIRSMNVLCPTRVFVRNIDSPIQSSHDHLENAMKLYDSQLKHWLDKETSFAVVNRNTSSSSPQSDLLGMVMCIPKNETLRLQQAVIRSRNHWYREHSKSPLASGFKSLVKENKNEVNIVYKSKQDQDSQEILLDKIVLTQEEFSPSNSSHYDVIFCETNLSHCLDAFLDDSLTETFEGKSVLKLNPSFVPFKLAITIDHHSTADLNERNKLLEVVDYLLNQLRETPEISIFPFVQNCPISIDDADALSIPFTVIIKQDSFKNGVVHLRNRDTRISETVHVSNFLRTILLYLRPIKLL